MLFSVFRLPLEKSGGDACEMIQLGFRRWLFFMGDLAGHGKNAAQAMQQIREALQEIAKSGEEEMRAAPPTQSSECLFLPRLFARRKGGRRRHSRRLEGESMLSGIGNGKDEIPLRHRLFRLYRRASGPDESSGAFPGRLHQALNQLGYETIRDDITMAAFCKNEPAKNELHFVIRPGAGDPVNAVEEFVALWAQGEELAFKANLLFHEFITNILLHGLKQEKEGCGCTIYLHIQIGQEVLRIEALDRGCEYDRSLLQQKEFDFFPRRNGRLLSSGRGIALIAQLASCITAVRYGGLNDTVFYLLRHTTQGDHNDNGNRTEIPRRLPQHYRPLRSAQHRNCQGSLRLVPVCFKTPQRQKPTLSRPDDRHSAVLQKFNVPVKDQRTLISCFVENKTGFFYEIANLEFTARNPLEKKLMNDFRLLSSADQKKALSAINDLLIRSL